MDNSESRFLTTLEVAERLGVSRQRVIAMIRTKRLPAVKRGREWIIAETNLQLVAVRFPGRPTAGKTSPAGHTNENQVQYRRARQIGIQVASMAAAETKDYDVGLSFAGEDQEQVERVLLELAKRNVRCFYDRHQIVDLWGTDLAEALSHIYTKRCRYFVPFVSQPYVSRVWPKYEFRSALQRAIRSDETFILPIRIDDSPFELLNENIFFLDLRRISPAEIADAVITELGMNVGERPLESPILTSAVGTWNPVEDLRARRHYSYISAQYPWWKYGPRLTLLATTPDKRPIPDERLRSTFLNTSVRYSEALNLALEVRTHAAGYTREFPSHRRAKDEEPLESWTCYRDGLVAYEWRPRQHNDGDSGKRWLNLNATAYNLLRALQLSNEVLDPVSSQIDVALDLTGAGDFVIPIFMYSTVSGFASYTGYHEPILRRFDRSAISGRDQWNRTCPPVEELLTTLARVFGLARLPQAYWDQGGILEYSKIGSRG
jgi:excisionase family DNA binding protein